MTTIDTTKIDSKTLDAVIAAHLRRYAAVTGGRWDELSPASICAESLLYDENTDFGSGDRSGVASVMFCAGFSLALRLVEVVANAPLAADVDAISATLDLAQRDFHYIVEDAAREPRAVKSDA